MHICAFEYIYRPIDGEWLYYKFVAESFQIKKLCKFVAEFIRLKLNFIKMTNKSLFEPPCGGLGSNVRTPSI